MLLDTLCSVALYCQRCGQIHVQDVPYFSGQGELPLLCGNCSQELALIRLLPQKGLQLRIPCGVCDTWNTFSYTLRQLKLLRFEKIYCREDHFELGYVGVWQAIAEFLDFNAAEYDALHPGDGDNFMGRQQVLLEAVNRVHDLVEREALICNCGSHDFTASVADGEIILECVHCGGYSLLPAAEAEDLKQLVPGMEPVFRMPEIILGE